MEQAVEKNHGFKKKSKHKKPEATANEYFKCGAFCVGGEGPEL